MFYSLVCFRGDFFSKKKIQTFGDFPKSKQPGPPGVDPLNNFSGWWFPIVFNFHLYLGKMNPF